MRESNYEYYKRKLYEIGSKVESIKSNANLTLKEADQIYREAKNELEGLRNFIKSNC